MGAGEWHSRTNPFQPELVAMGKCSLPCSTVGWRGQDGTGSLGCCPAWREGKQLRYQVSRLAHFHLTHPGSTEPVWCHLGGLLHDRATNSPKQLVLTCHLLKNYKPSCCRQRNLFAALSSARCSAHWRCCGHTVPSCSSVSPAEVSKVSWEEEQAPEACIKVSILNFSPLLGLVSEMLN